MAIFWQRKVTKGVTEHSHWRSQGEHTVTLGIISPTNNKFATFESLEVELPYLVV